MSGCERNGRLSRSAKESVMVKVSCAINPIAIDAKSQRDRLFLTRIAAATIVREMAEGAAQFAFALVIMASAVISASSGTAKASRVRSACGKGNWERRTNMIKTVARMI